MKKLRVRSIYTALFKDKDGKIVIAQFPNAPLLLWLATILISQFVENQNTLTILSIIGTIALAVWAILEIYSGVNLFRKILGTAVLAYIIVSRLFT